MKQEEQIALIRRALALIAAGGSERGEPAVSPVTRYLDPARHELEVERIFRRYPLALCPSASLANAGDSFAIDVAGMPLLFVRGHDGEVNGFVNACRHRGARLKPPGASPGQRALICPYHSWTYGLDGALRGRPSAEDFPHAPASKCSLARVPVAEALGFVWAVPRVLADGESPGLDIAEWLGRFGADLRSWGYDGWVPFHQRAFDNAANWKIPFEANLETYHFQYAHRDSIAGLFYDNLLVADQERQHQRLFLPKRSIEGLRDVPEQEWQVGPHSNIIYYFFPATFILHEGDHANAFTVLPESPGRSRVIASTLIPEPPKTEKSANYWRKNIESFWGALNEDFALGVSAQSTLASGAQSSLYFGATECCSARFHADVEAALAA
ncbi:aromatic ring-hydroxylating dioxygenase subunit alpha [Variovorax sp. NFACC27]|uniref:aromatic ring-hydroxylating oxygenase subunit alpha n=1 Tax=unclassified Variovorax TaxID=663243 RepID=UPI000896CD80|nr:Phenylpropionate dioxygenase, large terminal subunit [Variovorax sp. NFACC28]SEG84861.1 Phenylpropionate dioxygenase, large terminal subunit [Variovorax sp. NFACC29]SFD18651.1 Phenylpropionate dioxygenase, large terminal subunit [Variovorax sp. NFACC26]SFG25863.1 Phenylpropionate dioxygenase, large terminal subunit [Variovorax sp. NFACC27]